MQGQERTEFASAERRPAATARMPAPAHAAGRLLGDDDTPLPTLDC
jgi:hypothetical protein